MRQKSSGIQGRVLSVDGDHVVVDGPDGERRWKVSGLKLVVTERGPRGVQPVTERMVAAVRMVDEGVDRPTVMRLYQVERYVLQQWIEIVRTAREDEKNLEAMKRTG